MADAVELFEIRGDPQAMAHWDWPADETAEQTVEVARLMLADVDAGTALFWTVRVAADDAFAGVCDLSELDGSDSADLGFMFARRVWGRGYAREAIAAILEEALRLGISRLQARVHADNTRSCALLARSGFHQARSLADFEIRPGVRKPCFLYGRVLTTA
jgi:RimJ/RimL family protein N-acetyltransferase